MVIKVLSVEFEVSNSFFVLFLSTENTPLINTDWYLLSYLIHSDAVLFLSVWTLEIYLSREGCRPFSQFNFATSLELFQART